MPRYGSPSVPLAYEPWCITSLAANEKFTVPPKKVYEVFLFASSGYQEIRLEADSQAPYLCLNTGAYAKVFPMYFGVTFCMTNIDPATGNVTGYTIEYSNTCSEGWILTQNESIYSDKACYVRWRERKDLGSQ